ncbi:hypothetical protein SALBM217S_05672 [Streptomyces griseoloalbus]
MRSIRPSSTARRERRRSRRISPVLAAVALTSALALTATACESGDTDASGDSSATAAADDGKLKIPDDIADRLKELVIDLDKWRDGAWKNWDKDKWLRRGAGLRQPDHRGPVGPGPHAGRRRAGPAPEVDEDDISGDQGVTDPTPKPVQAKALPTTYRERARRGRSSSTPPRARWSAPRRWCRTRPTPASPTWCGRRASLAAPNLPDMYRIGCTMTGGSSGGGWFRVAGGETVLVSNTSIGPLDHTWLAGPRLGPDAEALYQNMSRTYGGS